MTSILIELDKKGSKKSADSNWSAIILIRTDYVMEKVGWNLSGGYKFQCLNRVMDIGLLKGIRASFAKFYSDSHFVVCAFNSVVRFWLPQICTPMFRLCDRHQDLPIVYTPWKLISYHQINSG